ncbi:MAG: response regulator transcription factor [Thermodesulfovibrionales bacterium]
MSKIKVMIADDHALVREGISAILGRYDNITVVGEASNGKEAIDKVDKLKPDVILMDIAMPGLGGLEATVEIKKKNPDIKILVLTQYEDKEYISRFLKVGVSGYMLKKAVGSELLSAINAISKGELYLHSSITSEVVAGFLSGTGSIELEEPYEKLTDREKQILKLIAEGNSHKEIAALLDISVKTVIAHQTNISEKLDLHSKAELMKFAIRQGIIKIDI